MEIGFVLVGRECVHRLFESSCSLSATFEDSVQFCCAPGLCIYSYRGRSFACQSPSACAVGLCASEYDLAFAALRHTSVPSLQEFAPQTAHTRHHYQTMFAYFLSRLLPQRSDCAATISFGPRLANCFSVEWFVGHQHSLSARIRKILHVEHVDGLPDTMPTTDAMRSTLLRRKRILVELLRKPLPETPSPALPGPPNRSPNDAERSRLPIGRPLFSRSPSLTRSESPRGAENPTRAEQRSTEPLGSTSQHGWTARLRPRDERNAAICGSRVSTTSECRPQVSTSSSSKEQWTPPR